MKRSPGGRKLPVGHTPGVHDPAEFLLLLGNAYWPILREPLRSTLPPIFDGVEVPEGERGEDLYDENGDLMV